MENLIGYAGGVWQIIDRRPGENEDLRCGWLGGIDDRDRRGYYKLRHVFGPNPAGFSTVDEVDPREFSPLTEMEILALASEA